MKYTKSNKKTLLISRLISISSFIVFLIVGCLIGCLFFIRPATSEAEMRELTKFPSFTLTSFLNGDYFSDVSLWYSDTYPGRDGLIAMQHNVESLYGIHTGKQMVGQVKQGDDIPKKDTDVKKVEKVELPENYAFDQAIQNQIMNGLYIEDGAAYSVYSFNQNAAAIYANALNEAGKELDGIADVYSLLVPNNSCLLSEETYASLGGSDQKQAIDYYFSLYENVTGIPVIEDLQKHREDEYLYFRTDHHWTSMAAYHAYKNFCEQKGIKAHKLKDFESMKFSPFLGTFYAELQLPEMAANPDYVMAYIPNSTNDMVYWDENGNEVPWKVINDVSTWNENSGYYCFIGGDKPLSIIDNPDKDDGSSVLVIKESYGNSFVPYLVDHYDKVYIADFRYTNIDITDYVKENKIDDVIFENNISIIGSEDVASMVADLI